MSRNKYVANQDLNTWLEMLHTLYGATQNYSKTTYEVHTHLTEVCGVFGKHLFKKRDVLGAQAFLPKMFAWAVALLKAMHPEECDLEGIILRKFPGVCPYCGNCPCTCSEREKPTLDPERVRADYYQNCPSLRRSVNDFQLMFRRIYGPETPPNAGETDNLVNALRHPFSRMIEELSEIAESIRFYHLYPENFENELADFFAWWFKLASSMPSMEAGSPPVLAEDLLWTAYPGYCPYCSLIPCFCRPGPVRELMSKPPPGQDHRFDLLTSLHNQRAYVEDIEGLASGTLPVAMPIGCVRLDVDDFKSVNDTYGHSAGDVALQHIANILRSKVRERDRVYRVGGDEFGAIMMDLTAVEAGGMMNRVCTELSSSPVRWVSPEGEVKQFNVSVSVGVSECHSRGSVRQAFEDADNATYASKEAGKAQVRLAAQASTDHS